MSNTIQPTRRQKMWSSKTIRGAIVGFGFVFGLFLSIFIGAGTANADCGSGQLAELKQEYGLACNTHPKVKKCVLNLGGAGAVGFGFGGPLGYLAGVSGAAVSCVIDGVTD